MKLSLSTLIKIAKEIEAENGIKAKCTVGEMITQLETCAGGCRTKASAKEAIADYVYNITPTQS